MNSRGIAMVVDVRRAMASGEVRELRGRLQLGVRQVARTYGFDVHQWLDWERGLTTPRPATCLRIARAIRGLRRLATERTVA